MFQRIDNSKFFADAAEKIINLLLENEDALSQEKTPKTDLRSPIGKILFALENALPKKDRRMFDAVSQLIRKDLPSAKNVSPKDLRDAALFYKAAKRVGSLASLSNTSNSL